MATIETCRFAGTMRFCFHQYHLKPVPQPKIAESCAKERGGKWLQLNGPEAFSRAENYLALDRQTATLEIRGAVE